MKKIYIVISALLLLHYGFAGAFTANAQKLPNKQEVGLYAPANIKVDGNATDWGNTFQAYNHATEVYYSIANDNDNLYMVIRATEPLVMRKIIAGSITLSLSNTQKSRNDADITITYPVFDKHNFANINLRNKPDDASKLDSFKNVINTEFVKKSKEMKITGIKAISDSLISVYNEYKIKAAAGFDDKIIYTCEFGLPLQYIKATLNNLSQIHYTITLNGSTSAEGATFELIEGGMRVTSPTLNMPSVADMRSISAPTYFSGDYILAKK